MKKALSCILVLAMFLSLGVFGGWNGRAFAGGPADLSGTYELTELLINGEDKTAEKAPEGATMILWPDGTGTITMGEQSSDLTWDETNIYDNQGVPAAYTLENDILSLDDGTGLVLNFKRTGDAPSKDVSAQSAVDTWVGAVDIKEFIVLEVPDIEEHLDSAPVSITLELLEDNTYTMSIDVSPMLPNLKLAMYSYLEATCAAQGVTVAQLEEQLGKSIDEFIDEALGEMDLNAINTTMEGVYEVGEGEIILDKGPSQTIGKYDGKTLVFDLDQFGEVELRRAGIVGIWTASMDLGEMAGEEAGEYAAMLEGIQVDVVLELRSDNRFCLCMDTAALMPVMSMILSSYLETYLNELGMSAEDLEAMTGQSLDELISQAIEQMDPDELKPSIYGTYEVLDNELTLKPESGEEQKAQFVDGKLEFASEDFGELCFVHTSFEDVLAKSLDAMSYAEYVEAEIDSAVTIEAYLQAKQAYSAEYGNTSLYLQDGDGAYFVYRIECTQDEYDSMVVGQKMKITGYKSEWSGEVEITDASFQMIKGSYLFRAENVTELLGTEDLIAKQNLLISVKDATVAPSEGGAAFLYGWDGSGSDGSDLYFNVEVNGETFTFVVESDLCEAGTDVYEKVKTLEVGDIVNLTGFLYWYEGPQVHVTSVIVK